MFKLAFWKDLTERVVRTFVSAAALTFGAGLTGVSDLSSAKALAWSGAMAGVTAVLALITGPLGKSKETASIIERPATAAPAPDPLASQFTFPNEI